MTDAKTILMVACDANIYYASGFSAPDPFVYLAVNGKSMLVMSDLEIGRARSNSRVDEVVSMSVIEKRLKETGIAQPTQVDILCALLRDHGTTEVAVPGDFGIELADKLRERGIVVRAKSAPFFAERSLKTDEEVRKIEETQRIVEQVFDEAVDILRQSEIVENRLLLNGKPLTSEEMRTFINKRLLDFHCSTGDVIVSCGDDACDPHSVGHGPLLPHQTIIFDIFPRSTDSKYYADMSRTVVRGKPTDAVEKMYAAILKAQLRGIELVRDGADSAAVHAEVAKVFSDLGYKTGEEHGKMVGFIHGTGHGLGLEVHEPPRIGKKGSILAAGNVVTVEPGLYYPGIGGIRLEDMVLVEKDGCRNLTKAPKTLEIDRR
ncbi:MAG: hypothetical protein A2Z34_02585 [Planctomycetes bacterium RBG_16_59_8]|nr:MAG: hypothetical protein A2Z34_02585 [Planctomycetes bacterium RBG_16_59_8]